MIVEGQAEWLKILVRNVFNNAFKYCTAHGSVTICLESTGSQVILSVLNQCQPLGDDQLARLTDRFYTLPGQDGRGVGLGLSIVKRIAELHGATLHLGSGSDEFGFSAQVRFPVEVHS